MSVGSITAKGSRASFSLTDVGMLLVVLIWGGNLTISRLVFQSIQPLPFIALRFGLALILLVIILFATGGDLVVEPTLRWRIFWVGLIGNTIYQFLFQIGLSLTTATNTALLISTAPIWMALIALFRGLEHPSRNAWAGIGLSFVGIALVLLGKGQLDLSASTILGDLLVLASAICWAIYTLDAKPILARYSALKTTTLTMLSGTPFLILAGIPGLLGLHWATVPMVGWWGVLYSSVLSIVVAYVIWYSSVQSSGPVRTAIYGNLVPVVGVLIAWLFGGEQFGWLQAVGAVAILVGLVLTKR